MNFYKMLLDDTNALTPSQSETITLAKVKKSSVIPKFLNCPDKSWRIIYFVSGETRIDIKVQQQFFGIWITRVKKSHDFWSSEWSNSNMLDIYKKIIDIAETHISWNFRNAHRRRVHNKKHII